jgi:membrane fusion protein, copper/silver efflux system
MKNVFKILILFVAVIGVLMLSPSKLAGEETGAGEKTFYTCSMHPQVIQDHPGNCPICGMKLQPIRKQADDQAVAVDPVTIQNMNIRTAIIKSGPLRRTIRTVGTIDYNETALAEVSTKFRGWIGQLYVNATGQLVHRGDPLFEISSPELYSAEVDYLHAHNSTVTNDFSAAMHHEEAANKLRLLDFSNEQIAALEKTNTAGKTVTIAAPADGFVIEKAVERGQMVEAGQKLYRLADLGTVWVFAQIYEQDMPLVKLGQEAVVKVASLPDREFRGRVTFVYPTVDEKTRTARVRMEFENPGYLLKPGMFVSVEVAADTETPVVLVPDSAVLRSGAKNTVFIALEGGKFQARTVVLGAEGGDGLYEAVSGVKEGERVVTSGQFMLDSESQLREAIEKMNAPKLMTNSPK